MATIRDVAKRANVSVGTVSRYLNGETLKTQNSKRIADAIQSLNYRQNIIAKGLKNNRSMSIGVLINTLSDVFATPVVSALESYVERFGYSIILCDYKQDPKRFEQKLEFLINRAIDGLVVFHSEQETPMLKRVSDMGIPIVAIDAPIKGVNVDSVLVDNAAATKRAISRLLDEGYQRIGIIAGQESNYIGRQRLLGYQEALKERGIVVNRDYIWSGDYTVASGTTGTHALMRQHPAPDALFAINYYMGLGTIKALNELHLKIGQDIGLIAFDRFALNDIFQPTITSISQPVEAMGEAAGERLMTRLHQKEGNLDLQTVVCPTSIIIGESDKKALAIMDERRYTGDEK